MYNGKLNTRSAGMGDRCPGVSQYVNQMIEAGWGLPENVGASIEDAPTRMDYYATGRKLQVIEALNKHVGFEVNKAVMITERLKEIELPWIRGEVVSLIKSGIKAWIMRRGDKYILFRELLTDDPDDVVFFSPHKDAASSKIDVRILQEEWEVVV